MDKYGIIIHGGAGNSTKADPKREHFMRNIIKSAHSMLELGESAINVSKYVITQMENSGIFNAGRGSYPTINGTVEMDAGIMDGNSLKCGGVGAIQDIENPIIAADIIMNESSHSLIVGSSAIEFVQKHGMKKYIMNPTKPTIHGKYGTVGAVVLDMHGDMASAVSTGGLPNRLPGRVGDSAIVGCGYYAENGVGSAVATGDGDMMMKYHVCKECCRLINDGYNVQSATEHVITNMGNSYGGIICIDSNCNFGVCYNTKSMLHGYVSNMDEIVVSM